MKRATYLVCLSLVLVARPASAAFDEFADDFSPRHFELVASDLRLVLKGEIELELHDLEGRGGPGFDSATDTRTLGTRSPFVEIDTFWLAPRLVLSPSIAVNSVLEFTPRGVGINAVWLDVRTRGPGWLAHHLEVGFQTPFMKIDRRTERYPLIATAYWRQPEFHVAYEGRWTPLERIAAELGVAVAMTRPLTFASVQDSSPRGTTINIVGYGPARPYSGNAPALVLRARLEAFGAFVEGFGQVGKLASEGGTDELRNSFGNYRDLPGADVDPEALDRTARWFGGRVGYDGLGLHVVAEAIASQESLLRRVGAYAQLSFEIPVFDGDLLPVVEPLVRYEVYRIRDATTVQASGRALRSPAPSQAVTWDFDILTLALESRVYRDIVRLRVEYALVGEHNSVPALGVPESPIRNNELLIQVETRF